MAERLPARLTASEGRRFAFTVGAAFAVLAGISWWRDHLLVARVTGSVSGLLLVAGVLLPSRLGPVHRAWMGLAHALSKVTTPVFMGLVYLLVLAPMGLLRRTLGSNPVRHEAVDGSYFTRREPGARRSNLDRQF